MQKKTRTVISKSAKRFNRPMGSKIFIKTEQVVYRTIIGKRNGKPLYASETRHEEIRNTE